MILFLRNHVCRNNEVRHKPIVFLFFLPIIFVMTLEELILHKYWALPFPILLFVFAVSIYVNEKMYYDDLGITICNILGRKYQILWSEVLSVEDTLNDPRFCRGAPGRIVKIVYKNKKQKTETVRYDYGTCVGLPEFLSFWDSLESNSGLDG